VALATLDDIDARANASLAARSAHLADALAIAHDDADAALRDLRAQPPRSTSQRPGEHFAAGSGRAQPVR
jgi:hypothetical protein